MIDKNNPDYTGEIQEFIWNIATNILPLEVTLPMVPDELREPCRDLYNFMRDLYNDMYANIEAFNFTSTHDVSHDLGHFFGWVHKKFHLSDDSLVASKSEYKNTVKHCGAQNVEIMFSRNGFALDAGGEYFCLSNNRYPGMLRAFKELLESTYTHYKVNSTDYLISCDFRALVKYKRTYADVLYMLSDAGKAVAEQIDSFVTGIKITPAKCTFFNRVDYKKKGKRVFILSAVKQKNLMLAISTAKIDSEAFTMVEKEIERYEDAEELKEFWRKNAGKCGNCNPNCRHKSNPRELFGKKMIICGGMPNVSLYNPKEQDIEHICRLIELRAMVIEAGLSE
jgi:hypothetical protein